ncbi:MAG: hypothetical protein NTY77_02895 [Elusimicrobia bacterium]|nr:hypothetical protein [Elusimicrobiota bacterium]
MTNRSTLLSLAVSALLCAAAAARAADAPGSAQTDFPWGSVTLLSGTAADLEHQVDVRSAALGKIAPANGALGDLTKLKAPLLRIAFTDVARIVKTRQLTTFVGRHILAASAFDFAEVSFPADIAISTHSAALVIGTLGKAREIIAANGQKVAVAGVSARLVGVVDGGVPQANGTFSFAPNSPIRIYQLKPRAKKKAAK